MKKEDLVTLEQMFRTFKTEGFKERRRYEVLCGDFQEKVAAMNEQEIRGELIQEYVRVMEDEFMKEYNPKLVQEIKEKEADILWREIFQLPYDSCNAELLKDVTKKLILRIELLQDTTPPFFGSLVLNLLSHSNLDSLTK